MPFSRRRLGFECLEVRQVLATMVSVGIPQDLVGRPGEQVLAPVNVDNAAGMRGVEIYLSYDTNLLDVGEGDVQAGSVWAAGDAEVVANVDDATGSIIAWVFAAEGSTAQAGSLLNIRFTIRSTAVAGGSTTLDLTNVRLNEDEFIADPAPQPGPDPTDGRITFIADTGTASISGFVYADTNNNQVPDPLEGIPETKIVLIRNDNGQRVEATTQADGRYDFPNLAAGSYTIEQVQPAAFLDGGANSISVSLTAGQNLTDQNFRELGLRPQWVYNRLFTTLVMPVGSTEWKAAVHQIVLDAENAASAATATSLALTEESLSEESLADDQSNESSQTDELVAEAEGAPVLHDAHLEATASVAEGEESPESITLFVYELSPESEAPAWFGTVPEASSLVGANMEFGLDAAPDLGDFAPAVLLATPAANHLTPPGGVTEAASSHESSVLATGFFGTHPLPTGSALETDADGLQASSSSTADDAAPLLVFGLSAENLAESSVEILGSTADSVDEDALAALDDWFADLGSLEPEA